MNRLSGMLTLLCLSCANYGPADMIPIEKRRVITPKREAKPKTLIWAVKRRNPKVAEQLIEGGADVNSPLCTSLRYSGKKSLQIVKLLLNKGADANITCKNSRLPTPLFLAVQYASLSKVQLLIQNGANIHFKMSNGKTPLMLAVQRWSTAVVRELIANGADVNDSDSAGKAVLQYASRRDIVLLLLKSGAHRPAGMLYSWERRSNYNP